MKYDFGEKKQEKNKAGQKVDVWVLPKYQESKKKAISIIEKYEDINEGDFWILKNETKDGTVMYSGLIISHNACLKINDTLDEKMKFRPECVVEDKEGYGGSLVYTYCCPEQGIFEVGEYSPKNCKNTYPYAMAFKRCFDRAVLKASKLAFDGIYSDSEADDFTYSQNASETKTEPLEEDMTELVTNVQAQTIVGMIEKTGADRQKFLQHYGVDSFTKLTRAQYADALDKLTKKSKKDNVIGAE